MHLLSISVDFALSSGHLGDLACQTHESKIASSVAGRLFILTYVPWRSLALVPQGFSRMFRSGSVLHYHHGTLAILLPNPAIPKSLVLFRVGFALLPGYLVDLGIPARKVQTARSVSGRLCIAIKVPWRSYSLAPRVTKVHWRS